MCVLMALRLHDGNDRDEFFLCLLRIKFWVLFLFRNILDKAAILSYNTTPAEEGRSNSLLLAAWLLPDHMFIISFQMVDHMWRLKYFFAALGIFLFCRRSDFRALLPPQNHDHISIIRYLDLTTSLTINRTGVHGDKMSREYEKAVFA